MVPEQVQIDNAIPLIPIKMAKTEKKKKKTTKKVQLEDSHTHCQQDFKVAHPFW